MEEKKITVHIVSHSHWDREWYVPFEIYRNRLNVLMENLFEAFDKKNNFKHFTLDGQTIAIEDYLERYPQMAEKFQKLVADGTIEVGPWYILPDEFLIQGETFVRNYLVGQSVLKAYDMKSSQVGYLPDMFGHTAYTPTLLNGLGLNAAVLWRGPGKACRKTEFLWEGENGDSLPAVHLIDSYSNGANFGLYTEDLVEKICGEIEKIKHLRTCAHVLLMNGTDHEFPIVELADHFEAIGKRTGTVVTHSTIGDYVEAVTQNTGHLDRVCGELKDATYEHILKDVLSSRITLKLMSFEAQQLFLRYVEPLSVLCAIQIPEEAVTFNCEIHQGWKMILQSLTHDGIGGCSTDRVQRKVEDRFADAIYLGSSLTGKYLRKLFPAEEEIGNGDDYSIVVFNPDDKQSEKIVETRIPRLDGSYRITDRDGNDVDYELMEELAGFHGLYETRWQTDISTISEFQSRICPHKVMEQYSQRIRFKAHIPSLGFAGFDVKRTEGNAFRFIRCDVEPSSGFENDFIRFTLNADGSFNLFDKRNGAFYENLNRIQDVADIGDEYNFAYAPDDQPIMVIPEMVKNISAQKTLEGAEYIVEIQMPLPIGYDRVNAQRSASKVCSTMTITYTVYNDSGRVDVQLNLMNQAKDHKTCFEITVPGHPDKVIKDSYYGFVRQTASFYDYDESMAEENLSRYALETLSAIVQDGKGLMVTTRGIHEFETAYAGEGTKAKYTLIRSVGMLSRGDLTTRKGEAGPRIKTPEAQCLCELIHQYSIMPLHEANDTVIMKSANDYLFKPVAICRKLSERSGIPKPFAFSAADPLFLKTLKLSEDGEGVTLRALNLSEKKARLKFDGQSFKKCIMTNMSEVFSKERSKIESGQVDIDRLDSIKLYFDK
jgi:alpha-mannosidase/mannosylglycerate hydrolase